MHTHRVIMPLLCSPQLAGFIRGNELNNNSSAQLGGFSSSSWELFDHVTGEMFLSL